MGPKEQLYMTAEKSIHISDAKLNGKKSIYYRMYMQARRKWGGRGARAPPHFLADQLTLSQPGGAHYPHPVARATPDFQTLRRPCRMLLKKKFGF